MTLANPTTLLGLLSHVPDDQTAIIQPEQNIRMTYGNLKHRVPDVAMRQDWEAGRPMELEAVVGAVVELGERLGVPMPSTRAVYACAKLLDAHRGQRVLASKVTSQIEGVAS
jgi:ketopantoate reductase